MPSQRNSNRNNSDSHACGDAQSEAKTKFDQAKSLAAAIAYGEVPVPTDLEQVDYQQLLERVAEHRQSRLVRYIARAIATDIHRSFTPPS
jgi:hypothetical protein